MSEEERAGGERLPDSGDTPAARFREEYAKWRGGDEATEDALCSIGDSPERTEFIAGLRKFADLLSDRQDIPIPEYGQEIMVFATGGDEEQRAQVDSVSRLLAVPVTDNTAEDGHYKAALRFGQITYEFIAIPVAEMKQHEVASSIRLAIKGCLGDNAQPRLAANDVPHMSRTEPIQPPSARGPRTPGQHQPGSSDPRRTR
jgi:hypothetical protein